MQTPPIICPVDKVIHQFDGDLDPLTIHLKYYRYLPRKDKKIEFPVGTLTSDGRLDLCKQKLGVEGITKVAEALKHNRYIKHVLLGTNAFGNQGAIAIANMLKENNTIETVYLGCNYIESEGVIALCEALKTNTTVKSLWLKRNPIGAESIPALISLLQENKNIRTLDLVNVCVGDALHALLKTLNTLERLYLGGNNLTAKDMTVVNEMLLQNKHLKGLFLSANNIGDEGVKALLPALSTNTTLTELSLSSCGITDEGVQMLTAAKALQVLDVGYAPSTAALGAMANQIAEKGIAAIAKLALQSLHLAKTNLSEALAAIPNIVMDGRPVRGTWNIHPDTKAIKSVYR